MKIILTESQFQHLDQWFISLPENEQNEIILNCDQLSYLGLSFESESFDEKQPSNYLYTLCICNQEKWENAKKKHSFLNI